MLLEKEGFRNWSSPAALPVGMFHWRNWQGPTAAAAATPATTTR
jgi:hypothetical protein